MVATRLPDWLSVPLNLSEWLLRCCVTWVEDNAPPPEPMDNCGIVLGKKVAPPGPRRRNDAEPPSLPTSGAHCHRWRKAVMIAALACLALGLPGCENRMALAVRLGLSYQPALTRGGRRGRRLK